MKPDNRMLRAAPADLTVLLRPCQATAVPADLHRETVVDVLPLMASKKSAVRARLAPLRSDTKFKRLTAEHLLFGRRSGAVLLRGGSLPSGNAKTGVPPGEQNIWSRQEVTTRLHRRRVSQQAARSACVSLPPPGESPHYTWRAA
jgi:hypothetical protein